MYFTEQGLRPLFFVAYPAVGHCCYCPYRNMNISLRSLSTAQVAAHMHCATIRAGTTMMINNMKYEHLDLRYILEVADGDRDFLEQTLSGYLASIPDGMDKLMRAVATNDTDQASFQAHMLKGAFNFIGNTHLAEMLDIVEREYADAGSDAVVPVFNNEITPLATKTMDDLAQALRDLRAR